jgi:hypothetical protein
MAGVQSCRQRNFNDADQRSAGQGTDLCAAADGFSLHAGVYLNAKDRKGLLRLIRYGARQCFSQDRLSELPDGRIRYQLARRWGQMRAITLEPTAFLHRLAALIPAPYLNLTRYHGCFAPNARRRCELINPAFRFKRRARCLDESNEVYPMPPRPPVVRSLPWAELLKAVFKVDVLKCPRCDQRLSIIAFITDLLVVRKILAHLHLPTTLSPPSPARLDVQIDLDFDFDQDPPSDCSVPSSCRDPPDSIALY